MNKQEFIAAIADELKASKKDATNTVNAVINVITNVLTKGDALRLVGFATLDVKDVPAKEVRNPQNGQKIKVPASKRVKFTPGKDLRDAVNKRKKK